MADEMSLIETERLLLRRFKKGDWRGVHEYASDPEVVRYQTWGPNDEKATKEFVRRAMAADRERPRTGYPFCIILKEEGKLIGSCSLEISNVTEREAWIGYCLNRGYWGRGLGTEMAKALIAFGFREVGLHRIFATCDPENVASARVLEKAGMRREGWLRAHKWMKGRWRDSFLYAILEDEWRGERA